MIKPIALATLFLGLATSCATYNKSPVATYDNAGSDGGPVNQIVNADKKTRPIKILRSSKKLVDGKLVAQVEIQNSSVHPIRFNYKFDWLDESGSLDSSSSTWNRFWPGPRALNALPFPYRRREDQPRVHGLPSHFVRGDESQQSVLSEHLLP